MNVSKISQYIIKNKYLLKTLEKVSEHGTSFSAGASLVMGGIVRPASILATPDTEKENKYYSMAKSFCSSVTKFLLVESIALPIELGIKNIDKNPKKFLDSQTIKKLNIPDSRAYKLLTQTIKLSTGLLTAIPKSILTMALIPIIMDNLLINKKENENKKTNNHPSFTGNNFISKGLGKLINNEKFQNWAIKNEKNDKDIPKHISALTDILLTTSFSIAALKSDKMDEHPKKALIYNNIISTILTIGLGYGLDKLLKPSTDKFIKEFKKIHIKDEKLPKYIEGINILRPAIIFAGIYYFVLPIFSTFMGEKTDKFLSKNK